MGKKSNRRRDKAKMDQAKADKPKVTVVNGRTRTETRNPPPDDLDLGPKAKWFLVYTAPRAEEKAKTALEDAGCKVFWPSVHVVITAPRRKPVEHDVGTFPRYLFVCGVPFRERRKDRMVSETEVITIDGRPIDDIRDIDGVVEVVGTSAGWQRVPSAAIAAIAGYQASKEDPVKPAARFCPGDTATVITGPFMSFQATIVETMGLHEAKVLIGIFGGQVPVTMGIAQLDAA